MWYMDAPHYSIPYDPLPLCSNFQDASDPRSSRQRASSKWPAHLSELRDFVSSSLRIEESGKLTGCQVLHSFSSVCQGIEIWPSHTNGCCTESKCFQNVGSPIDATVDVNLEFAEDFWNDLWSSMSPRIAGGALRMKVSTDKNRDKWGGLSRIQRPSPMVAQHNPVASMFLRFLGIGRSLYTLQHDW